VGQGGSGGAPNGSGGGPACAAALADYGDCDLALGWAFDGENCVPMSGCGCEPDCAAFTTDFAGCLGACDGFCDTSAFVGAGIADDGWGEGDFCDGISACVKSDVVPLVEQVVTATDCSPDASCGANASRCVLGFAGEVQPDLFEELCAATLIEDLDAIECLILGP
jgi:hypothetical protein